MSWTGYYVIGLSADILARVIMTFAFGTGTPEISAVVWAGVVLRYLDDRFREPKP